MVTSPRKTLCTAIEILESPAAVTVDMVENSNIRFMNHKHHAQGSVSDWSSHPFFAAGKM